jgi:hypothetical protein
MWRRDVSKADIPDGLGHVEPGGALPAALGQHLDGPVAAEVDHLVHHRRVSRRIEHAQLGQISVSE